MEVILYQPQIPQNTGNIVRTCAVTGCRLTLVEPLGFQISDRWLKRSGLDYWDQVFMQTIDDLESYLDQSDKPFTLLTTKGNTLYHEVAYQEDHILIFGSETTGLPETLLKKYQEKTARVPMLPERRCLNLATTAGIVIYEAQRQCGFKALC